METDEAQMATPRPLRRLGKGRFQAVHVIAAVAVVAKQQLFLDREKTKVNRSAVTRCNVA